MPSQAVCVYSLFMAEQKRCSRGQVLFDGAFIAEVPDTANHQRGILRSTPDIHNLRYHYLETCNVDAPRERGKSEWRRRVEADIRFDPFQEYAGMIALDLSTEDSRWEVTSAEECIREAHGDSQPLRTRKDD